MAYTFTQQQEQPQFDYERDNYERSEAIRRHYQTQAVGVIVPLLQALTTGGLLGALAGTVTWAANWGSTFTPFKVFFVAAILGAAIAWLALLVNWLGLVRSLETALNVDLDGDHQVGEPTEPPATVRVEVNSQEGQYKQTQFVDLPLTPSKLQDLARSLTNGASFSEAQFSGAGALLSRAQFRQIRDEFMRRGWCEWVNPESKTQGLQLTRTGRAVMRHLATGENSPTPAGDGA